MKNYSSRWNRDCRTVYASGFASCATLVLLCLLVFAPVYAVAGVIRVSPDGDDSDGLSWATAHKTIGSALVSAASGDDIRVASGTYFEAIEMKIGVDLHGGFAGVDEGADITTRDFRTYKSIIDATGLSRTVVIGASHTELDGFTIRNGRATVHSPGVGTGGIACFFLEEVVIRNCIIRDNEAVVVVSDPGIPIFSGGRGGGIRFESSQALVDSCTILSNVAEASGGGIFITGGGKYVVQNCFIDGNIGGGLYLLNTGRVDCINCTFGFNNFDGEFSPTVGRRNDLGAFGENEFLTNTIVRAPLGTIQSASYCNLPDTPGPGNIDADPMWVDPENGDYRLLRNSPCIDAGTDTGLSTDLNGNPRPVDVRGRGFEGADAYDMGCYEFQLSPADLDENGRVNAQDLILFLDDWHGGE